MTTLPTSRARCSSGSGRRSRRREHAVSSSRGSETNATFERRARRARWEIHGHFFSAASAVSALNVICSQSLQSYFVPVTALLYVLLKPFRALVTVKVPLVCADTLIQYAVPLCWGGAGACVPCGGGVNGATGMPGC